MYSGAISHERDGVSNHRRLHIWISILWALTTNKHSLSSVVTVLTPERKLYFHQTFFLYRQARVEYIPFSRKDRDLGSIEVWTPIEVWTSNKAQRCLKWGMGTPVKRLIYFPGNRCYSFLVKLVTMLWSFNMHMCYFKNTLIRWG